jgi:hypothetical protein
VELFPLARVHRLHPSDRDAQQDQTHREHYVTLRRNSRSLQVLLHPQLVSITKAKLGVGSTDTLWMTSTAGLKSSVESYRLAST